MPFVMLVLWFFFFIFLEIELMFLKSDLQVSSINLQGFFLLIRKSPDFLATKVGRSGLEWLSTATSSNDRWEEASYFVCRTEEFTQPEVTEEAQGAYGP